MRHYLTEYESKLARWLFKRMVKQGRHHEYKIDEALGILADEFASEFTEDNEATRRAYLIERMHHAVNYPVPQRPKCRWHQKKWTNRYFPEIGGYGFGWYCAKCGKFKHSPSFKWW